MAKLKANKPKKLFAQTTQINIKNVLKIKETFPVLPFQKIIKIHNIAFNPL